MGEDNIYSNILLITKQFNYFEFELRLNGKLYKFSTLSRKKKLAT